jgi:hypothetical protein
MKAVITKSQYNRIKNFINETKEVKKDEILDEKRKKKLSKKQLDTFDIDNDGDIEADDMSDLRNMKKITKKELKEASDCGCGEDKDDTRYMFFSNLEQMMRQARMLLQMDEDMLEDLLNNGHDWAADHIAEAKNNMDQVFDFIMNEMNGEGEDDSWDSEEDDDEEREMVYEGMSLKKKEQILEGTYQGRKVTLNKPFLTPDGPKKRSVYVKNEKGNVVKVNFGDPNMRIKKNIPERRKSFRARHKCETANDKTSAKYWSCRAW